MKLISIAQSSAENELPSLLSFSNYFGQKRKTLFEIVVDELIYLKFYSLSLLAVNICVYICM